MKENQLSGCDFNKDMIKFKKNILKGVMGMLQRGLGKWIFGQESQAKNWYLTPYRYGKQKVYWWWDLLPYIQESMIQLIYVNGHKHQLSRVLNKLSTINFKCLKQIYLFQCGINNIQSFTFVNAPQINVIDVIKCFVTSLKPLNKTKFNMLKKIKLKLNPIRQFDISRFKIKEKIEIIQALNVKKAIKTKNFDDKDQFQFQYVQSVVKMETQTIDSYRLNYIGKEISGKLKEALIRKFQ